MQYLFRRTLLHGSQELLWWFCNQLRPQIFWNPETLGICSRGFWRAAEHRERHLQTHIKMLGCFCNLIFSSQVLTSKKVSKGLVRSRVSRFPNSGSGLGPGGSFPFFWDLDPEESKYKTRSNRKAPSNVPVLGNCSSDSTTAILSLSSSTDALTLLYQLCEGGT